MMNIFILGATMIMAGTLLAGCQRAQASNKRVPQQRFSYVDITPSGQNHKNGFGDAATNLNQSGTELVKEAMTAPGGSVLSLFVTGSTAGQPRRVATLTISPTWTQGQRKGAVGHFAQTILTEVNHLKVAQPSLKSSSILEDIAWLVDAVDGTPMPKGADKAQIHVLSDGLQFSPILKASAILTSKSDKDVQMLAQQTSKQFRWVGASKADVAMLLTTSKDDNASETRSRLRLFYQEAFTAAGFSSNTVSYKN
jgi:hypothetical protein